MPDWPLRRRGHLLVGDLGAMGVLEPDWTPADLPGDPFGAVYVLEGSRFGGRVLARRTGATQGATRFLQDPGVAGGWRSFWEAVECELAEGRRSLAAMTEAAEAAFALFREAVDRRGELAPGRIEAHEALPHVAQAGP